MTTYLQSLTCVHDEVNKICEFFSWLTSSVLRLDYGGLGRI